MNKHLIKLKNGLAETLPRSQRKRIRRIVEPFLSVAPGGTSLEMLALKYGTGKLDHGYIEYYSKHFEPIRKKQLNILEIGIAHGRSLNAWRDYFENSHIYALDIHDKKQYEDERITLFQGDQNDPVFLEEVARQIGSIDVIIDDGSHVSEHVITSFRTLFPHLSSDGIYAIEDLHTSYLPNMGGAWDDLNNPNTSMSTLKSLADGLNYEYIPNRAPTYFDKNIVSMHFYPKLVFLYKGKNEHFVQSGDTDAIELALQEYGS